MTTDQTQGTTWPTDTEREVLRRCRLGYEGHDGQSYCHEHFGFAWTVIGRRTCDCKPPLPLPVHCTEACYPACATCDGGGCPDCTDPS